MEPALKRAKVTDSIDAYIPDLPEDMQDVIAKKLVFSNMVDLLKSKLTTDDNVLCLRILECVRRFGGVIAGGFMYNATRGVYGFGTNTCGDIDIFISSDMLFYIDVEEVQKRITYEKNCIDEKCQDTMTSDKYVSWEYICDIFKVSRDNAEWVTKNCSVDLLRRTLVRKFKELISYLQSTNGYCREIYLTFLSVVIPTLIMNKSKDYYLASYYDCMVVDRDERISTTLENNGFDMFVYTKGAQRRSDTHFYELLLSFKENHREFLYQYKKQDVGVLQSNRTVVSYTRDVSSIKSNAPDFAFDIHVIEFEREIIRLEIDMKKSNQTLETTGYKSGEYKNTHTSSGPCGYYLKTLGFTPKTNQVEQIVEYINKYMFDLEPIGWVTYSSINDEDSVHFKRIVSKNGKVVSAFKTIMKDVMWVNNAHIKFVLLGKDLSKMEQEFRFIYTTDLNILKNVGFDFDINATNTSLPKNVKQMCICLRVSRLKKYIQRGLRIYVNNPSNNIVQIEGNSAFIFDDLLKGKFFCVTHLSPTMDQSISAIKSLAVRHPGIFKDGNVDVVNNCTHYVFGKHIFTRAMDRVLYKDEKTKIYMNETFLELSHKYVYHGYKHHTDILTTGTDEDGVVVYVHSFEINKNHM